MRKPDTSTIARAKRRKDKRDRRNKRCARPSQKRRQQFKRAANHLTGEAFTAFITRQIGQRQLAQGA